MRVKSLKAKMELAILGAMAKGREFISRKHEGIDGLLVVVGLCIIALLLCVAFKDAMTPFINTIVGWFQDKAKSMLGI